MTAPKKPQDHKAKDGEMVEVTSHGVTVIIDPAVFNDMLLLTDLRKLQRDENAMLIVDVSEKIFGDRFDVVLKSLADKETGRVSAETFVDFLTTVMAKAVPNS